jgi:hypothetical protein
MTNRPDFTRRLGGPLAGLGAVAILVLTLFPNREQGPYAELTPLLCIICGPHGGADVFLNLLLFMPLAVGLRLLGWTWGRVVLASALLSLSVEILQLTVIPGRDASLSDLVTNTTGGAVGAALGARLVTLLLPDRRIARRLFAGALGIFLLVLALSALALQPWSPDGLVRSECTENDQRADVFTRSARRVTVNGVPVPCEAPLLAAAEWDRRVGRGAVDLEIEAVSRRVRGRALVHVLREGRHYLTVLAQLGRTAEFTSATAAERVSLYGPTLRLPLAFPADSGVPVTVEATSVGRRVYLAATHGGERREVSLALSPSHGWTAVMIPGILPSNRLRETTAVWLALLILPAAYWAWFAGRPAGVAAALAAAVTVGLGVLPALTGYAPVHWSEWAGAGLGVAVGWALHSLAAYLQSRCGSPSTSAYSSP